MNCKVLVIVDDLKACQDINLYLKHDVIDVMFALSFEEALGYLLMQDYGWVIINASFDETDMNLLMSALGRLKSIPLLSILTEGYKKGKSGLGIDKYYITVPELQRFLVNAEDRFNDLPEKAHIKSHNDVIASYNNLYMDYRSRQVFFNGMEIALTRREFDMLWLLSANPNQVFTFEQLYQEFWNETDAEEVNSVRCRIRRLRKKLGNTKCIESVRGIGYRFKPLCMT